MRQVALIVPDIHVGFHGSEPLHDTAAMEAVLDAARAVKPSEVIMLGDNLDLASWSTKFLVSPEDRATTQLAMITLREWLVRLRAIVGRTVPIIWLEGNHEQRIQKYLMAMAPEAMGLTPVGSKYSALSIPSLMALDAPAVNVQYIGPYGAAYWLWGANGVECTHGDLVRSQGGQTVAARLQSRPFHTCFGHIHRTEMASRTIHTYEGTKIIHSMSPGTLARLDGIVPGSPCPNWQNGFGLIHRAKGTHDITMQVVPILNGKYRLRWEP